MVKPNLKSLYGWSVTVALGGFLFGFDTAVISGAEQEIQGLWGLSDGVHGFAVAIALYGTVLGAMLGGIPSDRMGRKRTLFWVGVLYFVSALGSALAPDIGSFMVFRFIGGVGVGVSSVAAPMYISEISPARYRGRLVGLFQFNIVLGILIAYASNFLLGGMGEGSWRWMLGVETVPALLFVLLVTRVPKSPRWLVVKRDNAEEASEVLRRSGLAATEAQLAIAEIRESIILERGGGQTPLFSREFGTPIMLAFLFAFFNQVSGINAIIYYAPRILEMAGQGDQAALLSTVGIGLVNLVFTVVGLSLIDRFGRRTLMAVGSLGLIATLGLVSWSFGVGAPGRVSLLLFVYIAFFAMSQGAVIWVFIAEIFPNQVRAGGQALGSFTHWIMAAFIANAFPFVANRLGGGVVFAFFCGMMVLQLLFVWRLMPETKGASLEELEKRLMRAGRGVGAVAKTVCLLVIGGSIVACDGQRPDDAAPELPPGAYQEPHRPQLHFSPPRAWMNDPNGMVYFDGEYHLFYQHHPDDIVWGPMHWGHAVSTDLVHWEHLPIALYPDSLGTIFSGSAVVDWNNTAGFQTGDQPVLVAIFTQHDMEAERAGRDDFQTQGIAYSEDRGRTWNVYEGNPTLPNPGIRDFRDPKVRWHEATGQWVMVLTAGDRVQFYGSPDLKRWSFLSEFGQDQGNHGGVWECPDLFPMEAPDGSTKWVLLVSLNPGAPNGGSGTQYFVGDFDGASFTNDNPPSTELWLDWGRDNYAGVTWSDVPGTDGRRLFIGWNSNWDYAQVVPTETWRSSMTLPRELSFFQDERGLRVASVPVTELQVLRGEAVTLPAMTVAVGHQTIDLPEASGFEGVIELDVEAGTGDIFGLELTNDLGEVYLIGYDRARDELFSDRRQAGRNDFSDKFAAETHTAPYAPEAERMRLHLFVDVSSIEAFVDDGRRVMTELFFPSKPFDRVQLFSEGGTAEIAGATFYPLASIWE